MKRKRECFPVKLVDEKHMVLFSVHCISLSNGTEKSQDTVITSTFCIDSYNEIYPERGLWSGTRYTPHLPTKHLLK